MPDETPEEAAERMRRWLKSRETLPSKRLQESREPNPEPSAITPPGPRWSAAWKAALGPDPRVKPPAQDKALDTDKAGPQVEGHDDTQAKDP